MGISVSDVVYQANAGAERITKTGESNVALIDAECLGYHRQLECEHIRLLLTDEVSKGLDDVAAGRVKDARDTIRRLKSPKRVVEVNCAGWVGGKHA